MAEAGHCCQGEDSCCEQRMIILSQDSQEFHGYSAAEVVGLLEAMRGMAAGPDAATWTPGSTHGP